MIPNSTVKTLAYPQLTLSHSCTPSQAFAHAQDPHVCVSEWVWWSHLTTVMLPTRVSPYVHLPECAASSLRHSHTHSSPWGSSYSCRVRTHSSTGMLTSKVGEQWGGGESSRAVVHSTHSQTHHMYYSRTHSVRYYMYRTPWYPSRRRICCEGSRAETGRHHYHPSSTVVS
jgi:hypothetical protein